MKLLTPLACLLIPLAASASPISALAATAAKASNYAVTQHYPLGGTGGWDYLSIDAAAHHLFIARDDRVMVVDTQSGKLLTEISGMQHAHGVALAPGKHRGYVSNGRGNNVSVLDLDTLKSIGNLAISGQNPDAILYDNATDHLLTMNGRSNNISVIDPVAGKEIATIALPGKPEFAASDDKGNVFINIEDKNQIVHIDTHSNKLLHTWALSSCDSPSGLAFDSATQRLFSVCDNQKMAVTDASNGHQVALLNIGKGPDAVTFDPQSKLIFSSNGEGSISIVREDDADHYTLLSTLPTQKSARTMALDTTTHKLFLVAAKDAPRGTPVADFTLLVAEQH
ncbi:YncE family protein [Dyella silvatica]|uniref:YncE family protein n=1 Tax=Dyella silvatica TaxID=2992128 RepID=UPI00225ACB57|nr:YncE family protein [Dyella silvatica]